MRDLLGHASILTTERYDNQLLEALQAAVQRLETGKRFDPTDAPLTEASVSTVFKEDNVSRIFQDQARQRLTAATATTCASSTK